MRRFAFLALAVVAFPAAAQARSSVALSAVAAKKQPNSLVTFKGRAGSRAGAKVAIQRRISGRWSKIAGGRTGKHGAFALTWITPSGAAHVTVRAKLGRHVSSSRRFRILAPKKGATKVKVSKRTRIISPAAVQSVPTPGKAGSLTYAGGNDVQPGQIVVIGQGPNTPAGFIGRVTTVAQKSGKTVLTTVPVTLLQAVPQGSVHLVAKSPPGSRVAEPRASAITCEGSVGASITPSVTFGTSLDLEASWSGLSLESASLTASASLDASVQAIIQAAGSCTLKQRTLLSIKGPSFDGFVGPVPVVMTSDLKVYLDASASAQASLSTSADAGFVATAGVGWDSTHGFAPIGSFTPHFTFTPPTLSATASAAVNITPTVQVLFYGLVGPQVALKTGIEFDADATADPWWSLDIPVDVTASIAIPPLDLESPELEIYHHDFPLADAGGPIGGGPSPPVNNIAYAAGSVAAGANHSCALRSTGAVACWGSNASGQLGRAGGSSNTPVAVSGVADATAVAAGFDHSCALRVAGGVVCWGDNTGGDLGNGPSSGTSATPVAVSGISTATAIAAGTTHSCALLASGRVECWGANDQHQLGDGGTGGSPTPDLVDGVKTATAIAAGTVHSCAVLKTGSVVCWGSNDSGELGNGTQNPTTSPVAVSGITNATAVAAGANHSCALLATGAVMCWGDNAFGQLGNGAQPTDSLTPVPVSGITNAIGISGGGADTCAVLATGAVDCWGRHDAFGNSGPVPSDGPTPAGVAGIANASAVAGGLEHSCAKLQAGGVQCWGLGLDGELGNGLNANQPTPVAVTGFP
jgi:alpha-tubulin suppressor-like RCC1 family protein